VKCNVTEAGGVAFFPLIISIWLWFSAAQAATRVPGIKGSAGTRFHGSASFQADFSHAARPISTWDISMGRSVLLPPQGIIIMFSSGPFFGVFHNSITQLAAFWGILVFFLGRPQVDINWVALILTVCLVQWARGYYNAFLLWWEYVISYFHFVFLIHMLPCICFILFLFSYICYYLS